MCADSLELEELRVQNTKSLKKLDNVTLTAICMAWLLTCNRRWIGSWIVIL